MREILFLAITTLSIGLVSLGTATYAHAATVNLNVTIEGIQCDLEATLQQLGTIPDYCANKPVPIVEIPQSAPTTPLVQSLDSLYIPTNEQTALSGYTSQNVSRHTLFTGDIVDHTDSTVAQNGSPIAIIVAISILGLILIIDALYFNSRLRKLFSYDLKK